MTNKEKQELALLLGQVIGKQEEMHVDIKNINTHLEKSNSRLADVEHQLMTWKTRVFTFFAIGAASIPFIVAQSREFILSIIT